MSRTAILVLGFSLVVAWGAIVSGHAAASSAGVTQRVAEADVGMLAYETRGLGRRSQIFTIHTDGSDRRQLTTEGAYAPAWSADGSEIAYTTWGDEIGLMSADGSARRVIADGSHPAWSPDGQRLSYVCAKGTALCVVDQQTQEETEIVSPTRAWPGVGESSWAPDGSWIVFTRHSSNGDDYTHYRQLFVVRLDGSDLTPVPNTFPEATSPAWSPDGRFLLYTERYDGRGGEGSGDLWSIRPDGSERTAITDTYGQDDDGAWSPDGELIAHSSYADYYPDKAGIWTVTPTGERIDFVVRAGWNPSWRPGFTEPATPPPPAPEATGRRIAYVAATETGFDLFTIRPDGTRPIRLTHHGRARDPAWSPDHTRIAYVTGEDLIRVLDVATGDSTRVGRSYFVSGFTWSPNGQRLAWGDFSRLTVHNLRTGEKHRIPMKRGCCSKDLAWSPDGRTLAVSQEFGLGNYDIVTVPASGGEARRVTRLPGALEQLDWSPGGRRVLFTHRTGRWWDQSVDLKTVRPGGKRLRTLVAGDGLEVSPSWSRDGVRIAYYGDGPDPFGAASSPGLWTAGLAAVSGSLWWPTAPSLTSTGDFLYAGACAVASAAAITRVKQVR